MQRLNVIALTALITARALGPLATQIVTPAVTGILGRAAVHLPRNHMQRAGSPYRACAARQSRCCGPAGDPRPGGVRSNH
jgi:hypothetical protein